MADDRLEQLSKVEDAEATLRDDMLKQDGTVELSASDIVAIEPDEPDEETTQVIEKSQLDQHAAADVTAEDLRTTAQSEVFEGMTTEHKVPEALLDKMLPTGERTQRFERGESGEIVERDGVTQKLDAIQAEVAGPRTQKVQAVGTRPMPKADETERTAERSVDSGEWAEIDEDGFYTFIARADEEGRVKLPHALFDGKDPAGGVMVFVRAKKLK